MNLKSLTLKGFKSFADKSVLSLEPGVTVIVGPNGSGKSNISDAVLWVLGEQSAKTLRGQAMEDVVFAGSSARQPVGVAEVDLVLDNSDGTLPLEFDQVTITRRMFRNGESEYLVNQTPARLMDVLDLLHDTGLGRDTHSIISQGRLEEVLNSRPEDRRTLIEEAAGVLKHKKRRERALRKLTGLDAHLERAKDIVQEVDRQLRPLHRQATKALEHADLTGDLRDLEISLAVDDLRALQSAWDEIAKTEREADAEIDLLRLRLVERERELQKFQSLLEEKGLFVGDLSEQRRRMQSVLERLDAGLLLLEEKGKNLVDRLSDLRAKLHQSETRAAARGADLERLIEERAESDARLKALYTQLNELRRVSEASRKARLAADEQLSTMTASIRRARKELENARTSVGETEQALTAFRLEEELLAERAEQMHEELAASRALLTARRTRLEQLDGDLARVKRDSALADSDVDKRVRVVDSRRKELAEHRERLAAARAEARSLEEIDRAFASASPALAWALARERDLPGILGPVAELISVPPDLERTVERVLGADLFGLVVTDTDAAGSIARRVIGAEEGELSLIPASGGRRHEGQPPAGTWLVDLLECEPGIRPALEALLGDVCLVDSVDEALRVAASDANVRAATPDGALVWPSGKVAIGAQSDNTDSVLARKRRLNELQDAIAALSARVGEAEAEIASAEDALAAAQQDALELSQKTAALAGERDSLGEELGRVEEGVTTQAAEAEGLALRIARVRDRAAQERPGLADLSETIAAKETEVDQLEEEAATAREARDTRFREESAASERLSACQVEIATVSEREVHLKRQFVTITNELKELEETVRAARDTEAALELVRNRIQPLHDTYQTLKLSADHWAEKLRDRARFEQADSESLRETIHSAQDAVKAVQAEIDESSAEMSDLRVEKGQLEVQVSQSVRRIVEELGVPLEAALETAPVEDRKTAEDRAHKLRKQLSSIGPVNPIAMEEYEALRARREFMAQQMDDLQGSRKALYKIVAAIDRKMRDRFLETFEDVDRQFQEIFGVLFPGGQAQLMLTDPDDPENTGVEVTAQPRGKKLAKMSLMSGGEKALTALALLFAVYRTRPCPFYILDEVEAALDDVNLRRFVMFIDSMRDHTQFIVVTHQRRTMEMADTLYGVSMHADGVSKVVSQKLDRARETPVADDEHAVV